MKQQLIKVLICYFTILTIVGFAEEIKLGKGSYIDSLPGANPTTGKPYPTPEGNPKISESFKGRPIPTNDWASSLVWSYMNRNQFSENMYPHPLGVRTTQNGLELGYPKNYQITSNQWEGVTYIQNNDYEYLFTNDITAGLDNIQFPNSVLDDANDWYVTSLWKNGDSEFRAILGHGSPFVYFTKNSANSVKLSFKKPEANHHFAPWNPRVYEIEGISGSHNGSQTLWNIAIDANSFPLGMKIKISYDFNGNGKYTRSELYQNLVADITQGQFETFNQDDRDGLDEARTSGDFENMVSGKIKVEIWICEGNSGAIEFNNDLATLNLPFNGLDTLYFNYDGNSRNLSSVKNITTNDYIGEKVGNEDGTGSAKIYYNDGNILGIYVNGNSYGIYAPKNSVWTSNTNQVWVDSIISNLNGKNFYSIATLPDNSIETLIDYSNYAYTYPSNSKISYSYNNSNNQVTSTFEVNTDIKESGHSDKLMLGLYRHQWLNISDKSKLQNAFSYKSPRGEIKVIKDNMFQTVMTFPGILPALPNQGDYNSEKLLGYLNDSYNHYKSQGTPFRKDRDSYWEGKEFGKIVELTRISEQMGRKEMVKYYVDIVKKGLEDWFSYDDQKFLYYDKEFSTVIAYPESFYSGPMLNDHHFHYGYLLNAAALIAQYDPEWCSSENYGSIIELMINDVASNNEGKFTKLRNFDPYAGHSWASGHAGFAKGNNHESSSEAMNFATGLILYGTNTGRDDLRDRGIYLYTTEMNSIEQYWFDIDEQVFPSGFAHNTTGMVWGNGASYATWWTRNTDEIHGINFLPLTGGSMYLGRNPEYVQKNYDHLLESEKFLHAAEGESINDNYRWPGIIWQYLAFSNPQEAVNKFDNRSFTPEEGESLAHQYHWIHNLNVLGHPDKNIVGNAATSIVFNKNGQKTYVAYNPDNSTKTVTFSDGYTLTVSGKSLVDSKGGITETTDINSTTPEQNIPPTAANDIASTNINTDIAINVLSNDTDPNGDTLTVTETTTPSNGIISLNNNTITYTPNANYIGTDIFNYTINDTHGAQASASVNVTVADNTPNPHPPPSNEDYGVNDSEAWFRNTEANDYVIFYIAEDGKNKGGLYMIENNGTYTISLDQLHFQIHNDWNQYSFVYSTHEGQKVTKWFQRGSMPTPINNNPIANNDSGTIYKNTEILINVLSNDSDPDGDSISLTQISSPANGSALIKGNSILYTPDNNFTGTDIFNYTINDTHGAQASTSVNVTVTDNTPNPPPPPSNEHYGVNDSEAWFRNTEANDYVIFYIANDGENKGGLYMTENEGTYTIALDQLHFQIHNDWNKYRFIYSTSEGQKETEWFDRGNTSTPEPVNNPPIALGDQAEINSGQTVQINVLSNDSDPDEDTLSIIHISTPPNGTITNNGSSIVYTSNSGYSGSDSFSYTISDSHGATAIASVIVSVISINENLFPISIVNNSGKEDSKIYLTMIGRLADNENIVGHLNFTASELIPIKLSDNDPATEKALGYSIRIDSLEKSGNNTYKFHVPNFVSGRLYISVENSLPFHVNEEPSGLAEPTAVVPDGQQATASWNTVYDIVEMTWKPNENLFVNTSAVDFFCIPFGIKMKLNDGTEINRGYTYSRSEIYNMALAIGYPLSDSLVKDINGNILRLLGGTLATELDIIPQDYLQPAIDAAWNNFKTVPINTNFEGWNIYGKVQQDNLLHITASHDHFGNESFTIAKPSSFEAFGASGVLANGSIIERKIQAFIAATINRGVLHDSNMWWNRNQYYTANSINNNLYNKYAELLHSVSKESRCYAFSYDDVNGQDPSIWKNNQKELIITIPDLSHNSQEVPTEDPTDQDNTGNDFYSIENDTFSVTSPEVTDYVIIHLALNGSIKGGYYMDRNDNGSYSLSFPISQSNWNEYRFVYMTSEGQKETEWFKSY
ncbi:MAG: tandem-95 repeat protein [bacterium]|nr:tandem-95 repeat protein [bacterium]